MSLYKQLHNTFRCAASKCETYTTPSGKGVNKSFCCVCCILLKMQGDAGKPIYIGVAGKVYDMSASANFYGPGVWRALWMQTALLTVLPASPQPSTT